MPIKAILTDIEGTTSSIHFVKQVLFPYAAEQLAGFIQANGHNEAVQGELRAAAEVAGLSLDKFDQNPAQSHAEIIAILKQWIAEDRKVTALKNLQGLIWAAGYANGDYQAHIYADALEQMQHWQALGLALYVYSSGSIRAQQLFFQYSDAGDIRALFSGFFDTTSGAKQAPQSYLNIAKAIGLEPSAILFLSDVAEELDAATAAGMQVAHIVRAADGTVASPKYKAHDDFSTVELNRD